MSGSETRFRFSLVSTLWTEKNLTIQIKKLYYRIET